MTERDGAVETSRISEEALARLRARIGVEHPIEQPYIRYINADSILHMAIGLGDDNPLWLNRDYAAKTVHGKLVAPPAILYGASWGAWDMRRGEGLPGVHGLHSADRWTWKRPIVEGDEIRATRVLTKAELREGTYGGRSVLQVREFRFYDAADNLIATCEMSVVRAERSEARGRGKYADVELGRYSLEELDAIDAEIDAELPRGATPRLWDDVTKGEKLPAFVRGPLTIGDMLVWHMGAGGAAHVGTGRQWLDMRRHGRQRTIIDPRSNVPQGVQLVHFDTEIARYAAGMPAPYDIGAQRGAWTTVPFTNWIGDGGFLASMQIQYRSMNFLFDTTWWHVHVADKWRSPGEPHGFVECAVEAVNQRGEVTLKGSAICVLPVRGGAPLTFPIEVSPAAADPSR
jgi:acyl dehydratase